MTITAAPARARTARGTTVALKVAMAVTGVLFILFVIAHAYGNLKAFSGQAAFDDYAHHLRVLGAPLLPYGGFLWVMRVVLLASLIIHAGAAFALWSRARKARGHRYVVQKKVQQTYASRTMRWGGVILLVFVIFHILQFTTLTIEVGGSYESPYQRMVAAFSPEHWWLYLFYLVAMLMLAFHVRHGIWSAVATLGGTKTRRYTLINGTAVVVALLLFVGFMITPTAILLGFIE